MKIDFKSLNQTLVSQCRSLLPQWLPAGEIRGSEYQVGSINGERGTSLSINMTTGRWKDFASSDKGGDLVSLYAAINSLSNGEAARILSEQLGVAPLVPAPRVAPDIIRPPVGSSMPDLTHPNHGAPIASYAYKDTEGRLLFFISRYQGSGGGKTFSPLSFGSNQKWIRKGWPTPRPMYGLELLQSRPKAPILIVEGEKACEAARTLWDNKYICMTWPNGVNSWDKTDFSPIYGRTIRLWPDADEPGHKAMRDLAAKLHPFCHDIKLFIDPTKTGGWDAADALAEGWTYTEVLGWAKSCIVEYTKPKPEEIKELPPPPAHITEDIPFSKVEVLPPENNTKRKVEATILHGDEQEKPLSIVLQKINALGLKKANNTSAVCSADNCLRVLEGTPELRDLVWYDEFHNKLFTQWNTGVTREWSDQDTIHLMVHIQRELEMHKISETMINQAITHRAYQNKRNEPRDWMESLVWDQTPRVDTFLRLAYGAPDTAYSRAASKNWWVSMAARIYQPGCKVDNMVILEGGQGKFKSSSLRAIGDKWYTEANESITSKDFYMILQGKLIVEIAELDSFNRAETNTIKKVITCASDRFRPPYGRSPQDFPRRSIFVGTTNEDEYLRDQTGGRRFWPIQTGDINIKYITDNREQLFAEAVHLYKSGQTWWEMPHDETKAEQESRRQGDPWEEIIIKFMEGKTQVTNLEVSEYLSIDAVRLDKAVKNRIGKILKILGFKSIAVRIDGKVSKVYVKDGYEYQAPTNQPRLPIKPYNYAPGADNEL